MRLLVFFCLLFFVEGAGLSHGLGRVGWPTPAAGFSSSGGPEVLFTFDDGPHETRTKTVLDALAKHDIKAIFFVVGRRLSGTNKVATARKQMAERILHDGHLWANHTISHAHLCKVTDQVAAQEIDENRLRMKLLSPFPSRLFRAPYGDKCTRLEVILAERRLSHFHWDIDPREFLGKDAVATANYVIGHLKNLKGRSVVLMHDTKAATAKAIPVILDWLAAENARRKAQGGKPIRILSGSDVIREQNQTTVAGYSYALTTDLLSRFF